MTYLNRLNGWLYSPYVKEEDKDKIDLASEEETQKMFSSEISFSPSIQKEIRLGSSFLNSLTLRKLFASVAQFLIQRYGERKAKENGIAFSYTGNKPSFLKEAESYFSLAGFTVLSFFLPHPPCELSYVVRYEDTLFGIQFFEKENQLSLSFYGEKGSRIDEKTFQELEKIRQSLPPEWELGLPKESKKGKISFLDEDGTYDISFIQKEISSSFYSDFYEGNRLTKVLFLSSSSNLVPMILGLSGYEVETDKTKSTNLILRLDEEEKRVFLSYLDSKGKIQKLSFAQTASLLLYFLLETEKRRNQLIDNDLLIDTLNAFGQPRKIAEQYKFSFMTVLPGFSSIVENIDKKEEEGYRLFFSYDREGEFLFSSFVRESDPVETSLFLADMNEFFLRQGKTMDLILKEMDQKTGHFYGEDLSFSLSNKDTHLLLNQLRERPLRSLAGFEVKEMKDYEKRVDYDFTHNLQGYLKEELPIYEGIKLYFKQGGSLLLIKENETSLHLYFEFQNQKETKETIKAMIEDLKTYFSEDSQGH